MQTIPFSFYQILSLLDNHTDRNRLGKTFLLNNNTFDAEKSDYVRPTIVITDDTSKLSTIASGES